MQKNIGIVGRLLRLLLGMVLLYLAWRLARREGGGAARKLALGLGIAGFVSVAQGYFGVCMLRSLGMKTPA